MYNRNKFERMMRTPVKNVDSETRGRLLRNLGSTITIGRSSPKTNVKSTHKTRTASSSHQMAAILYDKPMSPASYFSKPYRKAMVDGNENFTPGVGFTKRAGSTKLIDNSLVKPPYPFADGKENVAPGVEFAGRAESTKLSNISFVKSPDESTLKDFPDEFCKWLKRTEKDVDIADFARLKADLCELVGRYTLEFSEKQK